MAKLNIWIRNEKCEVVNRRAHLHIMNCHGNQIFPTSGLFWFESGHTEVQVPPGCYIITAGVVYGNVYTDMTMVVVRCGDDACVNLVLNKYREEEAKSQKRLILRGCEARINVARIIEAAKWGIEFEKLDSALDVLMEIANLDKQQVIDDVRAEIEMNKEILREIPTLEKYLSRWTRRGNEDIKEC